MAALIRKCPQRMYCGTAVFLTDLVKQSKGFASINDSDSNRDERKGIEEGKENSRSSTELWGGETVYRFRYFCPSARLYEKFF